MPEWSAVTTPEEPRFLPKASLSRGYCVLNLLILGLYQTDRNRHRIVKLVRLSDTNIYYNRLCAEMKLTSFCEKCQQILSSEWRELDRKSDSSSKLPQIPRVHRAFQPFNRNNGHGPLDFYSAFDLEHSTDRECQLCMLFRASFGTYAGYYPERCDHVSGEVQLTLGEDDDHTLWIRYPHGHSSLLCLLPGVLNLTADVSQPEQTGDRDSYADIKAWLDTCRLDHDQCRDWAHYGRQSSTAAQRPTRLLFIDGDSNSLRLVSDPEIPSDVQYVTLSHCWGGGVPVQLTSHTASDLQSGYRYRDLPRTFREAVTVTRELGFSYLWIDALCIIQDSHEDWELEAPKMAYVYSQSCVSIAATAAEDSTGGLLCQVPTFISSYHAVETSWTEVGFKLVVLEPHWSWYRFIGDAPLNTRAWVFQELALAPRTVHFAGDKIWWSCREFRGHEVRPKGVNIDEFEDPSYLVLSGRWDLLVSRYSKLSLTNPSDKLAAIAGIARLYGHIQNLSKNDYLAGHWISIFPEQLLWAALEPGYRSERTTPSWSWTSSDSEVMFFDRWEAHVPICEVADVEIPPGSDDLFLVPVSAVLHLQGFIHRIEPACRTSLLVDEREAVHLCIGGHAEFLVPNGSREAELATENHMDCARVFLDNAAADLSESLNGTWFLPIFHASRHQDLDWPPYKDYMMELMGLLVLPNNNNQNGGFTRVGFLFVQQDESRWDETKWTTCSLQDGMFTNSLGNGRYSFKLT